MVNRESIKPIHQLGSDFKNVSIVLVEIIATVDRAKSLLLPAVYYVKFKSGQYGGKRNIAGQSRTYVSGFGDERWARVMAPLVDVLPEELLAD